MKAKRERAMSTLDSSQTAKAKSAIAGVLAGSVAAKNAVEDALAALATTTPGTQQAQPGGTTTTDLNLNNTTVFRTLSEEKKIQKFRQICSALQTNTHVKSLEMTNAEVGDSFCSELARVLPGAPHLTEINLNSNPISSCGIKILCEALKDNSTVTAVKLDNLTSTIDRGGQQAMLDMLSDNTTLTKFVYIFPQKQDNDLKDKYLNRNSAAKRRARSATTLLSTSQLAGPSLAGVPEEGKSADNHSTTNTSTAAASGSECGQQEGAVGRLSHARKPKIASRKRAPSSQKRRMTML